METTLVKADDKGRVPVRGAIKGRKYLVTAAEGGWWVMPAPKVIPPHRETDPLLSDWEVRAETLESFYDPAKKW